MDARSDRSRSMRGASIRPRNGRKDEHDGTGYITEISAFAQFGARHAHVGGVISAGAGTGGRAHGSRRHRQDCTAAEAVSDEAAVFAMGGPQFPDAAIVRRHPPAHVASRLTPGAFGARLGPKEAYRFARGEEVTSSTGQPVKLSRPLDFLVVADHSDNMGFFPDCLPENPRCLPIRQAANGMT